MSRPTMHPVRGGFSFKDVGLLSISNGARCLPSLLHYKAYVSGSSASQAAKEEVDSRSIYVGNVDYACTAQEVQQHFRACGTVNRVTILTNQFGQPKGCAYVEFLETDAIHNALLLNESVLHGRRLKVSAKRTNIPGMNQYQGRRTFGIRYRRPSSFYPPPAYGLVPRFGRPPIRFRPY